ncbi:hypothetical protein KA517_05180 [Candidatus Gracilibacteria bacterium]|nr:hypothetical protein [Candidatus Gracilibacteria bacterium]
MANRKDRLSVAVVDHGVAKGLTKVLMKSGVVSAQQSSGVESVFVTHLPPLVGVFADQAIILDLQRLSPYLTKACQAMGIRTRANLRAVCMADFQRYFANNLEVGLTRRALKGHFGVVVPDRLRDITTAYLPYRPAMVVCGLDAIQFSKHHPDITTLMDLSRLAQDTCQLEAMLAKTLKAQIRSRSRHAPSTHDLSRYLPTTKELVSAVRAELRYFCRV